MEPASPVGREPTIEQKQDSKIKVQGGERITKGAIQDNTTDKIPTEVPSNLEKSAKNIIANEVLNNKKYFESVSILKNFKDKVKTLSRGLEDLEKMKANENEFKNKLLKATSELNELKPEDYGYQETTYAQEQYAIVFNENEYYTKLPSMSKEEINSELSQVNFDLKILSSKSILDNKLSSNEKLDLEKLNTKKNIIEGVMNSDLSPLKDEQKMLTEQLKNLVNLSIEEQKEKEQNIAGLEAIIGVLKSEIGKNAKSQEFFLQELTITLDQAREAVEIWKQSPEPKLNLQEMHDFYKSVLVLSEEVNDKLGFGFNPITHLVKAIPESVKNYQAPPNQNYSLSVTLGNVAAAGANYFSSMTSSYLGSQTVKPEINTATSNLMAKTLIAYFMSDEKNFDLDGIFRITGNKKLNQDILEKIQEKPDEIREILLKNTPDGYSVANLLNLAVKGMKLSDVKELKEFIDSINPNSEIVSEEQIDKIKNIVNQSLSLEQQTILRLYVELLNKVSEKSEINQMNISNLVKIAGPNIYSITVTPGLSPMDAVKEAVEMGKKGGIFVKILMLNHDKIFTS